jgi:hypothetical protein
MRKLMERYNPKTYMKLLKQLIGVVRPSEVKDVKGLQMAVEEWEMKMGRLEDEYGESISNNLKVAILISIVPQGMQEQIFEIEKGTNPIQYEAANETVVALAVRRAEQRTPKEDEIMAVERRRQQYLEGEGWAAELWAAEEAAGVDIDAVGMGKGNPGTKCHRCQGTGHMARECGSPWDMFKGKGNSKGNGKPQLYQAGGQWNFGGKGQVGKGGFGGYGGFKGKGKGESGGKGGGGKGYQGWCYGCGQQGHKKGEGKCGGGGAAPMDLSQVEAEWWGLPGYESKVASLDNVVVEFGGSTFKGEWNLGISAEEVVENVGCGKVVKKRKIM